MGIALHKTKHVSWALPCMVCPVQQVFAENVCVYNKRIPVGSCLVMKDSVLTGICGGRGIRHAIQIKQLCKSVENRHRNVVWTRS